MLFVVTGSAKVVDAWIIVVTTVTVNHHLFALVKSIFQDVHLGGSHAVFNTTRRSASVSVYVSVNQCFKVEPIMI